MNVAIEVIRTALVDHSLSSLVSNANEELDYDVSSIMSETKVHHECDSDASNFERDPLQNSMACNNFATN